MLRVSLPVSLAGTVILSCLGCAAPVAPGPAAGETAAGQPKSGGYLRQLLPYSVQNLDPHTTENYTSYGFVSQNWFQGLTTLDYVPGQDWRVENKAVPLLAESWKLEDPNTWVFTIRKGVTFSNGDPLTAEDVVFSLKRILDPNIKANPQVRSNIQSLTAIDKLDDFVVRVVTKDPQPDLVVNLAQANMSILSKKYVESGADLTKAPVGTGPFKVLSYTQDVESVAGRNETYWEPGKPRLDGIKSKLKVEDSTVIAAIAAQQGDIMVQGDKVQFQALAAISPGLQSSRYTVNSQSAIFINNRGPLGDVRVRRALHLGLDRQEMDGTINFGDGVQTGPLTQAGKVGWTIPNDELLKMPGYRQPKQQDLAEAKRLLAEAGYPNGFKTALLFSNDTIAAQRGSESSQAQWKQNLGIQVDLVPGDSATVTQKQVSGDYDMVLTSPGFMDAPLLRGVPYFSSNGVYAKAAGVKDPEVDKLIQDWQREFDPAKQAALSVQLQRLLLDKLYSIPVPQLSLYQVWQPWVHDWVGNFGARPEIRNPKDIWMDLDVAPADRRTR
jgi:peptide/nickel transport system substrate-binding protein